MEWMPYPPEQKYDGGCKVAWHFYADRADAEACAEAAKHNAIIQEGRGFDFGYCAPGMIDGGPDAREDGLWRVCVP